MMLFMTMVAIFFSCYYFYSKHSEPQVSKTKINKPMFIETDDQIFYETDTPNSTKDVGIMENQKNIDYFVFEPLPKDEEVIFFEDIEAMFLGSTRSINDQNIKNQLIRLNDRGFRGVSSILKKLSLIPTDTNNISVRLAMVDYLGYRMKFDSLTRNKVQDHLDQPLKGISPPKIKAMRMNENIEILKYLARYDSDLALTRLAQIKDPIYRSYAAVNIETGFLLAEMPPDIARERIREVYPQYDKRP